MKATGNLFIGCMTGTSVDGLDLALVQIDQADDMAATQDEKVAVVAAKTLALPEDLRDDLLACGQPSSSSVELLGQCDSRLGEVIGDAICQWLSSLDIAPNQITAIGSHGQTVRHRPPGTSDSPFTLQIGDPNRIAEATGIPTVADFRRRDMAAGGQGAPLAPAFHHVVFGHLGPHACVINIGGISNLSPLGSQSLGFDSGPGNCLMDEWYRQHHPSRGRPDADALGYDAQGAWAGSGQPDPSLLQRCLADPYFAAAAPKSTGREYFNSGWLERVAGKSALNQLPAEDVQSTLAELTAQSIAQAVDASMDTVTALVICGGGRLNAHLMQRIEANVIARGHTNCEVHESEHWQVDGDAVEAAAFAWLAYRRINHLPGNLSAATGASGSRILGAIYPA